MISLVDRETKEILRELLRLMKGLLEDNEIVITTRPKEKK